MTSLGLSGCGLIIDHRADRNETAAETAYPPEGRFVEVDGVPVHVLVEGKGPDLVLIHGASGNTRDFTYSLVDRLKSRYRVLVFDRPGLGYTGRAGSKYEGAFNTHAESPALQARMLQAAAARLGADSPLVLGHSYGAAVALAWALEKPEAVSGLVIVSGASNPWPGDDSLGPLYDVASSSLGGALAVPLVTAVPPRKQIDVALGQIFWPQAVPPDYLDHLGIGLTLRRASLRANARQVNSLRAHLSDMALRYGEIEAPVEIVHGTKDMVVPIQYHAEVLAQQVASANLTRLRGIGHMAHQMAPDRVVAAIDRAARRAGLR